jgi:2'-phosphotransferase
MNRTHIHFATGLPGEGGVISGMRRTASVYIFIDPEPCLSDGIDFFLSANGVVLTDGVNGILSTKYFQSVKDSNGVVLMGN